MFGFYVLDAKHSFLAMFHETPSRFIVFYLLLVIPFWHDAGDEMKKYISRVKAVRLHYR